VRKYIVLSFGFAVAVTAVFSPRSTRSQPNPPPLEKAAYTALQRHCARCHDAPDDSGGFDYVLDLDKLVAAGDVVPRSPESSPIMCALDPTIGNACKTSYNRMPADDEIIPGPDIDALVQWIRAGAPSVTTPAPACANRAHIEILADLKKTQTPTMPANRFRYLLLTPQRDSGDDVAFARVRAAAGKLLNSLSWRADIHVPPVVGRNTALRIDLDRYGISPADWDYVVAEGKYPYAPAPGRDTEYDGLRGLTGASFPAVRADWFEKVASADPAYSRLLRLPSDLAQLETILAISGPPQRVTVSRSKIVNTNGSRIIERREIPVNKHYSKPGYYWKTIDFLPAKGPQHASKHATSNTGDGQEIIFSLPNGMHGFYLTNDQGNRVDAGPTTLVIDRTDSERKVRLARSCFSCHVDGLREDVAPDAPSSTFFGAIANDNVSYRLASRPFGESSVDPIFGAVRAYGQDLEFWQIAAELGLTGGTLAEKIVANAEVRASIPDRKATMKRRALETSLSTLSGLVCPPPPPRPGSGP